MHYLRTRGFHCDADAGHTSIRMQISQSLALKISKSFVEYAELPIVAVLVLMSYSLQGGRKT